MNARTLRLAVALVFGTATPAFAASLAYDDPAMHYEAPAGWTRFDFAPADGDDAASRGDQPAAVFLWHRGQSDQRSIVITIRPFEGSLDVYERQHESDLRQGGEGTFVDKKTLQKLANGMPVYVLKISSGSDVGKFVRRYDYLAIDGQRSIDVQYAGRQGDFDDADVAQAMSSLSIVLYPAHRS